MPEGSDSPWHGVYPRPTSSRSRYVTPEERRAQLERWKDEQRGALETRLDALGSPQSVRGAAGALLEVEWVRLFWREAEVADVAVDAGWNH